MSPQSHSSQRWSPNSRWESSQNRTAHHVGRASNVSGRPSNVGRPPTFTPAPGRAPPLSPAKPALDGRPTYVGRPSNAEQEPTAKPPLDERPACIGRAPNAQNARTEFEEAEKEAKPLHKTPDPYVPPIPFPSRVKTKKQMLNPYVPPIRSIVKKETKDPKPINSFPKRGDPGGFDLSIILDSGETVSGLMDLGAAVNLMPYSIFKKINSRVLQPTEMRIELADGTVRSPLGVVEDVTVLVGGLRVVTDFVVLHEGQGAKSATGHLLLLGRPFMATTRARIDVGTGTLSMAGEGGSVTFSVFGNSLSTPSSSLHSCSFVKLANPLVEVNVCEISDRVAALEEFIDEEESIEDDEFFSCVDEDEDIIEEFLQNLEEVDEVEEERSTLAPNEEEDIIEEFLRNLEEVDEVEDESSTHASNEEVIINSFLSNLTICETSFLAEFNSKMLEEKFELSVGESRVDDYHALDRRDCSRREYECVARSIKTSLGATGLG